MTFRNGRYLFKRMISTRVHFFGWVEPLIFLSTMFIINAISEEDTSSVNYNTYKAIHAELEIKDYDFNSGTTIRLVLSQKSLGLPFPIGFVRISALNPLVIPNHRPHNKPKPIHDFPK